MESPREGQRRLSVKEILSLRLRAVEWLGRAGPGEEPSERRAQQLHTPCWERDREGAQGGCSPGTGERG